MQTEVSGSQRTARVAALKGFGVGALVVGLIALMAVAAMRETAKPKPQQVAASTEAIDIYRKWPRRVRLYTKPNTINPSEPTSS